MSLRAGFAEVDITPKIGTEKAGWLEKIKVDTILDPVFAKVAMFESRGKSVAFVSLDTVSIRWTQVNLIRKQAEGEFGIPTDNIMIAATHNHAGPATVQIGETTRDEEYLEFMVKKIGEAFTIANRKMIDAKIGVKSGFEGGISFNRRWIMKDGSVKTHPEAASPDMLCAEGVIDPEVGVLCVKDLNDRILGYLVNFACHPTNHGGDGAISAGFPGVLAKEIKKHEGIECVCLFLNGACGNIHHTNPVDSDYTDTQESIGMILADDVMKITRQISFDRDVELSSRSVTLNLPIRDITEEITGNRNSQRFRHDKIYMDSIERLRKKKESRDFQHALVQVISINDNVLVGIPAEYFVELGFKIKEKSKAKNTYIVSCANGMVGYVPHRQAFERGGYETTLAQWSKLIPEAGDLIAKAALDLIQSLILDSEELVKI